MTARQRRRALIILWICRLLPDIQDHRKHILTGSKFILQLWVNGCTRRGLLDKGLSIRENVGGNLTA